jgi:hypothetical protein
MSLPAELWISSSRVAGFLRTHAELFKASMRSSTSAHGLPLTTMRS